MSSLSDNNLRSNPQKNVLMLLVGAPSKALSKTTFDCISVITKEILQTVTPICLVHMLGMVLEEHYGS